MMANQEASAKFCKRSKKENKTLRTLLAFFLQPPDTPFASYCKMHFFIAGSRKCLNFRIIIKDLSNNKKYDVKIYV